MRTHLKMKICSLAAEAKIIGKEEKKWRRDSNVRASLRAHRTGIVRREARHSLLAYGFLRGRRYGQLESADSTPANWTRVTALVAKYGDRDKQTSAKELTDWRAA